jgi:hypothetical protein
MQKSPTVSATMALDALDEASRNVDRIRADLTKAIAERDTLIIDAKASGIPYTTLGRRSRLSLKRLQHIVAKPSPQSTEDTE